MKELRLVLSDNAHEILTRYKKDNDCNNNNEAVERLLSEYMVLKGNAEHSQPKKKRGD